jgi:hypothetical protein
MIVKVAGNGKEAIARDIEVAMLGDANLGVASWEFNVFRNQFVKEDGVWKVQHIHITPLIVTDYYIDWGTGGAEPLSAYTPPFLNVTGSPMALERTVSRTANSTMEDLERRLKRSAAYDGSENQSHAYGY